MSKRDDDFDGPFFRMQMRGGGKTFSFGGSEFDEDYDVIDMDRAADDEYWSVRRSVRKRLRFARHLVMYLGFNTFFFLLDWGTGGGGSGINWAQWVALVWSVFLGWEFVSAFVGPQLWGREAEKRMIERELRRRRNP
jgi:cytochrome c biogenesis protein CcdA